MKKIIAKTNWWWIIVGLIGIVVLCGWIFGIPFLTSLIPGAVTMKIATACCFGFTALSALCKRHTWDKDNLLSTILSLAVLAISFYTLGVESLPLFGTEESVYTVAPGIPSLATIASFVLVNICLLHQFPIWLNERISWLVTVLATVAIIGYVFSIPMLFYYYPGISTGMAIHTAIGFILCSLGIRKDEKTIESSVQQGEASN